MALWKDSSPAPAPAQDTFSRESERPNVAPLNVAPAEPVRRPAPAAPAAAPAARSAEMKETVIAPGLTLEGKIDGAGHVRIAGNFKGDVSVDGNLTIESGAHLTGQVRASAVVVAGELVGNITDAKRVELVEGGIIDGDVKSGSLTVSAGSRMRGKVEFGWDGKGTGSAK